MSSFPRELSKTIDHGRAAFLVQSIDEESKTLLRDDARWLLDYAYRNVRNGNVPMRDDISPTDMKQLLPNVMILQPVVKPDATLADITVRLMGSAVAAFYGDVSGASIRELGNEIAVARGFKCIEATLASRKPVVGVSERTDFDAPYHHVTMLFIPVQEKSEGTPQILVHFDATLANA